MYQNHHGTRTSERARRNGHVGTSTSERARRNEHVGTSTSEVIQKHTCEYTKCINVQALTCEVTASEKLISRFVKRKQPSLPVLSGTWDPVICRCCTLYTLCTVHCTLYTVHCTLCTVHCTLYTVHCTPSVWLVACGL